MVGYPQLLFSLWLSRLSLGKFSSFYRTNLGPDVGVLEREGGYLQWIPPIKVLYMIGVHETDWRQILSAHQSLVLLNFLWVLGITFVGELATSIRAPAHCLVRAIDLCNRTLVDDVLAHPEIYGSSLCSVAVRDLIDESPVDVRVSKSMSVSVCQILSHETAFAISY